MFIRAFTGIAMKRKIVSLLLSGVFCTPMLGMELAKNRFYTSKTEDESAADAYSASVETIKFKEAAIITHLNKINDYQNRLQDLKIRLCMVKRRNDCSSPESFNGDFSRTSQIAAKPKRDILEQIDAVNDDINTCQEAILRLNETIDNTKKSIRADAESCLEFISINKHYPFKIEGYKKFPISPLAYAGIHGCVELMKALIHAGAQCDSQALNWLLEQSQSKNTTDVPWYDARLKKAIELLLDHGASIDKQARPEHLEMFLQRGKYSGAYYQYERDQLTNYLWLKYAIPPKEYISVHLNYAALSDLVAAVFKGENEVQVVLDTKKKEIAKYLAESTVSTDNKIAIVKKFENDQAEALAFAAAHLRTDVIKFLLKEGAPTDEATKVIKGILLRGEPDKRAEYQKMLSNFSLCNAILNNPAIKFDWKNKSKQLPAKIRDQLITTPQDALRVYLNRHDNFAIDALDAAQSDPTITDEKFIPTPALRRLVAKDAEQLLIAAAKHCDVNSVKKFLAAGVSATCQEPTSKYTALMYACQEGFLEVAHAVLDGKKKEEIAQLITQKNCEGRTPLILACLHSKKELIEFLLSHGATDNTFDTSGYTGIMHILSKKCSDVQLSELQGLILQMLENLTQYAIRSIAEKMNEKKQTPFQLAAKNGFDKVVSRFLGVGADPFVGDETGMSPWLHAVAQGHVAVAQKIYDWANSKSEYDDKNYALKNTHTTNYERAIHLASKCENPEAILQFLIDKQCYEVFKFTQNESHPLIIAAKNAAALRLLLPHFRPVLQYKNHQNDSALTIACASGNTECAKLLLQWGAKANEVDGSGFSCLMHAAYAGNKELVDTLIVAGNNEKKEYLTLINQHSEKQQGTTALILAAGQGHLNIVKTLVELGADMNARDAKGQTALDAAVAANKEDVVTYLKKKSSSYFSLLSRWF